MRLSDEETEQFYRTMWGLLHYTNQRYPVVEGLVGPDMRDRDPGKIMMLHEELFSHPELIDEFASENPQDLTREELDIVRGWKAFIRDRFLVVAHLKAHSVFLAGDKDQRAYGVVGLIEGIEDVMPPFLPQLVNTILLPFKGRIVYCGVLHTFNVHIGPNMRRGIKDEYRRARSRYGIITSLDGPVEERDDADEEMLRYYLGSAARREEHWHDIEDILDRRPELKDVRSRELGRSHARRVRKRLKALAARSAWFAVFEEQVVASGKSEKEARDRAHAIIPQEKHGGVHVFRFKGA